MRKMLKNKKEGISGYVILLSTVVLIFLIIVLGLSSGRFLTNHCIMNNPNYEWNIDTSYGTYTIQDFEEAKVKYNLTDNDITKKVCTKK